MPGASKMKERKIEIKEAKVIKISKFEDFTRLDMRGKKLVI